MWYFALILVIGICIFIYIYQSKKKEIIKYISLFLSELKEIRKEYITYSIKEYIKNKYNNIFIYPSYIKLKDKYIETINIYNSFDKYVDIYNKEYIDRELARNKDYFDKVFKYSLDEDQRLAIVTDEDNSLIVAGAGSGKTSTMVAKAKYLIDRKNINPEEIIVISFTNNAVNNFKDRVGNDRINCYTFHKLALNIINKANRFPTIDSDLLYNVTNKYITKNIVNDTEALKSVLNLMFLYIHMPDDIEDTLGEKIDYERGFNSDDLISIVNKINFIKTLKNDSKELHKYANYLKQTSNYYSRLEPYLSDDEKLYEEIKRLFKNHMLSLGGDKVKSQEELIIANYLYLHGIRYEYEKIYKYANKDNNKKYRPDFYLSDYDIYLEHFGIDENGRTPQYSRIEEEKYLNDIEWKRMIHEENHTKLIETYSYQFTNRTLISDLEKLLIDNGVEIKDINYNKLYKDIIDYYYFDELNELQKLIVKYIKMFKSNNYKKEDFDKFIEDARNHFDIRSTCLLILFKKIYNIYQDELSKSGKIDLEDLLNIASEIVKSGLYQDKVKYIIVDEYQDIALSRFELIKAIQKVCNCKIVCVGDDWQSIFRFSGCDLDMFVNFKKYLPNSKIMFINNTYRNSQELINMSSNFIMKNDKGQLKKNLKSNKHLEKPIKYFYYNNDIYKASKMAIDDLISKGCKNIAILGRNNSDLKYYISNYDENKIVPYKLNKKFNSDVTFYTIHKAKGLEFDGVVLCNMKNALAGFPNKMSDDPVLKYVTISEDDFLYEEERRLLYVALTRTKTYCNILVPNINASMFSEELMKDNSKKIDSYMVEKDEYEKNPICPKCMKGKLIVRTNGKDGSKFVSCINYPKCDYHSNTIDIIKNPIKCTSCGGFLIKKNGTYGEFYGCTNYPFCHETMNIEK